MKRFLNFLKLILMDCSMMKNNLALPMTLPNLISTIDTVHQTFQTKALQNVSVNLTLRNFVVGYYIVEYEQNGRDRAAYGSKLIDNMAQKLSHIKGMSSTALKLMRQFYLTYPQISQSVTDQFKIDNKISRSVTDQSLYVPPEKLLRTCSFTHFIELIKIDDELKRTFYEVETIKGNWSVRELKRQVESLLYERVRLSVDKKNLLQSLENKKTCRSLGRTTQRRTNGRLGFGSKW